MSGATLTTPAGRVVALHGLAELPDAPDGSALVVLQRAGAGLACVWLDVAAWAEAGRAGPELADAVARHAEAGAYTVLHGDVPDPGRYRDEPAVLFSLPPSGALAGPVAALRAAHPRAVALVPAAAALPGTVLCLDASAAGSAAGGLSLLHQQPLLVGGWHPLRGSPLANERLVQACVRGHVGWIAHDAAPWTTERRGASGWSRAAYAALRALLAAQPAMPDAA